MTEPSELFTKKDSLPKSVTDLMQKAGIEPMAFWILFEYYQIPSGWEDGDTPGHEEWKFYLPEYDKDPIYLTEEGHEREIDKIPAFSAEQLCSLLPDTMFEEDHPYEFTHNKGTDSGNKKWHTISYESESSLAKEQGLSTFQDISAYGETYLEAVVSMLEELLKRGLLTKGADHVQ